MKSNTVMKTIETSGGLDLQVYYRDAAVPGIAVIEVYTSQYQSPIGNVYFHHIMNSTRIDILDSWVRDGQRRKGVRSAMNDVLRYWWPKCHIVSDCGAGSGGEAFMKAYGYRKLKNGTWFFQARKLRDF